MDKIIVGVCGDIGHGKTTLAKSLRDYFNTIAGSPEKPVAIIRKIAYPLYESAKAIVGEDVDKDKIYRVGSIQMTGRELLQILADQFRQIDRRILVDSVVNFKNKNDYKVVICDDVRTHECRSIANYLVGVRCRTRGSSEDHHNTEKHVQYNIESAHDIFHWSDGVDGYETPFSDVDCVIEIAKKLRNDCLRNNP